MATIYYDDDCDLRLLDGRVIGVVGYGSQGHAQAQNLRDSGCQVLVAEAESSSGWQKAQEDGFEVSTAAEMARKADIIVMLAPDTLQPSIYRQAIKDELSAGKMLMFAHGFNIHYGQIVPPPEVDVTMIAPKCPGHMLRQLYTEGIGPPALVAVEQDAAGKARDIPLPMPRVLAAAGLGFWRQPLPKRQRPTFLESRQCFVVALPPWLRPALIPWLTLAINRNQPTLSACMSLS